MPMQLGRQLATLASTLVIGGTAAAAPPTDGLIGYWPLSGNADDASGNGHHGTLMGGEDRSGGLILRTDTVRQTTGSGRRRISFPCSRSEFGSHWRTG